VKGQCCGRDIAGKLYRILHKARGRAFGDERDNGLLNPDKWTMVFRENGLYTVGADDEEARRVTHHSGNAACHEQDDHQRVAESRQKLDEKRPALLGT
jgi:hypothetical protein